MNKPDICAQDRKKKKRRDDYFSKWFVANFPKGGGKKKEKRKETPETLWKLPFFVVVSSPLKKNSCSWDLCTAIPLGFDYPNTAK